MELKTKGRKWLFVVAVGIVGLLVIFFIALAVGNIVTGNILDKTIARLKNEGFRVSPKGLMPVCSDDENAAIPWEKACKLFSLKSKAGEDAYIESRKNWSSLTPEDKKELRELLEANEPVLELLREAASRPYFTFKPDYSRPMTTWQWPWPPSASYGMPKVLIEMRGRLALDDGDREEALECCILGLQSARCYSKLPSLVQWFMQDLSIFDMSLRLCKETMSGVPVSKETGQKLIQLLDPQVLKDSAATTLDVRRLKLLDTTTRFLAGENVRRLAWPRHTFFRGRFAAGLNFVARPIIRWDTSIVQGVMIRAIKAIRGPYLETKSVFREIEHKLGSLSKIHFLARYEVLFFEAWTDWTGRNLYSGGLPEIIANLEARAQVTRLALACKLFESETGGFPSDLEELVPTYFKELPLDPFTGKDFVYQLKPEGGFIIYSVGPSYDAVWQESGKEEREGI